MGSTILPTTESRPQPLSVPLMHCLVLGMVVLGMVAQKHDGLAPRGRWESFFGRDWIRIDAQQPRLLKIEATLG